MKRLFLSAPAAMFAMLAPAQTPDPARMDKLKVEMEKMVAQSKVIGPFITGMLTSSHFSA